MNHTESDDPFLHRHYDALGDSPLQRKLRRLCPLPVGVVYVQQWEQGEAEMRGELRAIRALGLANLQQFHFMGRQHIPLHEAEGIALEEGVIPHWYGIAGWKDITPELLTELGLPTDLSMAEAQRHPRVIAYQMDILRERSRRRATKETPPKILGGLGEPSRMSCAIPPEQVDAFVAWLKQKYETPENCLKAYKMWRERPSAPVTPEQEHTPEVEANFWRSLIRPFVTDPKTPDAAPKMPSGGADFRRVRDVLRFQADRHDAGIRETATWHLAWDTDEPVRTGCHHVLENQAAAGWDFELQAKAIAPAGSFYGAFHPSQHLKEVDGELDIPCYLTARLVADFAKGGWPAMWETTGGPTNYSGTQPFAMDGDTLMRCWLSYLAAGLKGIGIWSWNARDHGWQIGEDSLCDLTGKPTDRARAAGKVAHACERWRFELWEARDEPLVGVLYSWENDAAFARLSMGGDPTDRLKTYPVMPSEARIGAARALIKGNIPFEFVTERDLAAGLAHRYRHIYVPHALCLSPTTVRILLEFAEAGGHVLTDAPTLLINADTGNLYDTRVGTDYEQLFGFEHAGFQNTINRPATLDGLRIEGQTFEVNPTTARPVATYDNTDRPAILENDLGAGRATAFTFELSRLCLKPGNTLMENMIENYVLGWDVAPWRANTDEVLIYRRVAPTADHYFLINPDDQSHRVRVSVRDRSSGYRRGEDCISGKSVQHDGANFSLALPAGSARWVRLEK